MNNRLDTCFAELKAAQKTAFISFITAGDPEPSVTVNALHALVAGGADILELGVPFSDPSADGPTIQKSNQRALVHKVGLQQVLQMVAEFRTKNTDTPVVLMGYLNPIAHMGYESFIKQASQAGVDGLITVDLPPEEAADFNAILARYHLYPIYLLAPTSTDERIQKVAQMAKGFVYYVSVKGVTGSKVPDYAKVGQQVAHIKTMTDLPVAVGFGIKDADAVQAVSTYADGVVVGSAIVELMQSKTRGEIPDAVQKFIERIKQ